MLDSSIPLMAKGIDGLKMLDDGSQIAQLWKSQKTDSELNRLYKETNGDLNKMLEIGKTSPMARFVMPQLQAQQAAQQKALLDQQKTESEIYKNMGSGGKDYADAGEINQKIAAARLLQAKQAVFAGAASGNPEIIRMGLNGAKAAGALDEQTYTQFIQQLDSLGKDPVKISEWAKGAVLAGSQNPASFVFQTKDNEADNAQSDKNSQRTYKASIYGADKDYQLGQQELQVKQALEQQKISIEQAKLELEQKKGTVQQFGDGLYMVYPNGSAVPISSPTGQPITKSNPALKTAIEEERQRTQKVSVTLDEVEKLLDDATGSIVGRGVDYVGRFFGGATDGDIATAKLGTLGGQLVALMPKMSGPQSDKDVEMYKQMAGKLDDPTIPVEIRKAALGTIRELNNKYSQMNEARGQGVPYANASGNTQSLSGAQAKGFQSLIEKHTK